MKKMRFCTTCRKYTLKRMHCNKLAISAHPAPFKNDDRFAFYRRSNLIAI